MTAILLLSISAACTGVRTLADPTVVIRTTGGSELGVSTDYGVAFLGRSAQAGRVEVTAWFGDGPQTESSAIEPVGGGVYTADIEIRLPQVPISFREPKPGDEVLVIGRKRDELWDHTTQVRSDPRVSGILLPVLNEVDGTPDQVGAGVFVAEEGDSDRKMLVGLVSGTLTLTDGTGTRRYLTVVGLSDLWRLVAHRRELDRSRRPVYREDVR